VAEGGSELRGGYVLKGATVAVAVAGRHDFPSPACFSCGQS